MTTGDNVIPSEVQGEAWETPATINHTWGYKTYDHDWKSPGDITFKLIEIVSKGGNYLRPPSTFSSTGPPSASR